MISTSLEEHVALRRRAEMLLQGIDKDRARPLPALSILYTLASDPATADQALGLLHELQIHQMEVDVQHEDLRRAHADLELALARQLQLYHAAPVAYVTIDPDTTIHECNARAEEVFGLTGGQLLGRTLDSLIQPPGQSLLRDMLTHLSSGARPAGPTGVRLTSLTRARSIRVDAVRDPAGRRFLLAISEVESAT